ncbi:MAG: alpha/beta hydrolase, partial [Cyanobacteria bacterium P01_A01_bin.135]
RSIGGAIAVELARQHPEAAGLVLESTFTSMAEMVTYSRFNVLFPVQQILTERFDSLAKIPDLQMPVLLFHGTADTVVSAHMSQILYDAAPEPKSLVWIEGADHNNLTELGSDRYKAAVREFVGEVVQTP